VALKLMSATGVARSDDHERIRQESTGVHFGVDRSEADGIGISGPESTNPPTRPPSKNTILALHPVVPTRAG